MHIANQLSTNCPEELALANVLSMVRTLDLPEQARRNMVSAINTVCRVLDRDPDDVPAHAPALRPLLSNATPRVHNVSLLRWRNAKSDLYRALKLLGFVSSAAWEAPYNAAWEPIINAIGTASERSGLRRLARFCTRRGVDPHSISDAVVCDYHAELERNELSKTPTRVVKDVVRTWNRIAAARANFALPQLSDGKVDRSYAKPWTELPLALAADAAAFYEQSLSPDWFEDDGNRQSVRVATAIQRDRMLRRLASAELLHGVSMEALGSLAGLVSPENLRLGLDFMIKRNGGKPNRQVFEMALLAQTIGRHWAKLPPTEIATLSRWVAKFRPKKVGMTEKNRERLRQFSGGDGLRRLVQLPEQVFAGLAAKPTTPTTAREAQRALVVAILLAAPMRLKNLRLLDRSRHFRRALALDTDCWHLVLPADEVKNERDLEYPVPPRVMSMIDVYMERYQPLLAKQPTTALFPGRKVGTLLSDTGMRRIITEWLQKRLGIDMNPHLFRHLSALIFLRANPGQYESVRQLLGHKNLQTTIEFYAGFESDEAMRRFATVLDTYREPQTKRAKGL